MENCPSEECKFYPHCYRDRHHEAYPRADYKTKLEKDYRSRTVVFICRALHEEIHATQLPPPKPSIEEMREVL